MKLEDVLAAKEARYARQQDFLARYRLTTMVSITINMPGPVKDLPVLRRLRDYAGQKIKACFSLAGEEQINLSTGPAALLAVEGEAAAVKAAAVAIEENQSFGRLLDIDVFTAEGQLLSRPVKGAARGCFVCGGEAIACMRSQQHSREELQQAVDKMLRAFCAEETRQISPAAGRLGALAVEAMLYEVTCTPSPGLVDRVNSGAHRDMDFFSFMASSAALGVAMNRCAQAGLSHEGSLDTLLPVLRLIGLEGEKDMLAATGGVNTQKGLVFLLGIMAAAAGWLAARSSRLDAPAVLDAAAVMAAGIVERELARAADKPPERLTAGERLYLKYGITGIRGELEEGLPAIKETALPELRQALQQGMSINDALVQTLLKLMTCVEDTTVMNRHNPEKMRIWVKEEAAKVLAAGGMGESAGRDMCREADARFIAHNVSPGGAADLLAVTWFLHRLEEISLENFAVFCNKN